MTHSDSCSTTHKTRHLKLMLHQIFCSRFTLTTDNNVHRSMVVTESRQHKVQIKINDADRPMINVDAHIKLSEITQQLATCRNSTTSSVTVCTIGPTLLG